MKYAIATLGCKVNQFETQAIQSLLDERGHICTEAGDADIVIVNTCAVTGESERKSRQAVRRLRQENPGALAVVCGCASQLAQGDAGALCADVIYGTNDRAGLAEAVERLYFEKIGDINIDDPFRRETFELLPAGAIDGRTRAYIKIQDGCDNFCSYCIIPYARGRVRSLPLREAARQAEELSKKGFRELVITGIEIASYGKDLRNGETLSGVIAAIAQAAPKSRIRLGSLEPTVVTEEFCRELVMSGSVCPHFHLSLQSGCDETLRRMNRRYDTARFYESVERLRRHFPGCAVTTDLIAGFPGESDEEFEGTLSFIRKCGFSLMHIFPYSARPGTRAAELEGQVPKKLREQRAKAARAAAAAMREEYFASCVGKTLEVLFENESGGHAGNYCEVRVTHGAVRGEMRRVLITGAGEDMLYGKII